MAVYKIFAEKDTTLYSDYNSLNSGMDPILELSKNASLLYATQSSADRILIKFSDADINYTLNNYISNRYFNASLKLYLANATGLPTGYTIEAKPIYGPWDMGTGRYADRPITTDGASWVYRGPSSTYFENISFTGSWIVSAFPAGVTASFTSINPGGGNWYTASASTQSFNIYANKDINIDVSNIIYMYVSQSIPNDGILLKTADNLEFNPAYNYTLNYFSRDTNTIYAPVLEFKWDDSSFNPTGSAISPVTSQDIRVSLSNNKGEFNENEIYRFRLNVRDQFPVRFFNTSSLYTNSLYLPSSSYYAIKDVKSDTTVVDFDYNYTKISADNKGNYFDIYMNGLEPERYYKLLIKTVISGSTLVFDNEYFFKVLE
jgi:hypothetical protein